MLARTPTQRSMPGHREVTGQARLATVAPHQAQLGLPARGAHRDRDHEAVALAGHQRERAEVAGRVLGGDDEERLGQAVRRAVDGDLLLGHGLEQRRLGARAWPG